MGRLLPVVRHTMIDLFAWGTPVERERRTRIKLCVAAYCYEYLDQPVLTDAQFDALANLSDPSIITGRHDDWWRNNFQPFTGSWIHSHPELAQLGKYARRCSSVK